MSWPKRCVECGGEMFPRRWPVAYALTHQGRGLCGNCYMSTRRSGDLPDRPRQNLRRQEVVEEWAALRGSGVSPDDIAARLGIQRESLDRALQRAGVAA